MSCVYEVAVSPIYRGLAFLAALYSIYYFKSVFRSFVFWMNQFLSECMAGSDVHWNVMLAEHSPEFF